MTNEKWLKLLHQQTLILPLIDLMAIDQEHQRYLIDTYTTFSNVNIYLQHEKLTLPVLSASLALVEEKTGTIVVLVEIEHPEQPGNHVVFLAQQSYYDDNPWAAAETLEDLTQEYDDLNIYLETQLLGKQTYVINRFYYLKEQGVIL